MATAAVKKAPKKASVKKDATKKRESKTPETTYDEVKHFAGAQYTGMPVGRSHKWYYDKGDWRETKITPDLWEISYNVTKRRAGYAPEGSGVPIGTEYQWYIMAHQNVRKLNEDDYTTELTGLKFKVAHKRYDKETWSASSSAQRKRLIKIFRDMIADLETEPIALDFSYNDSVITGEAMPVSATCAEGACAEFNISIGNRHLGIIKRRKSGWKMDNAKDEKFIRAIGKAIEAVEGDMPGKG